MRVAIFGSGQTGNMVASILAEQAHEIVGFVDDDADILGHVVYDIPVIGNRNWLLERPDQYDAVCVGIGTIAARRTVCTWLRENQLPTISAIHSSAVISAGVVLGDNLIVGASTTLYVNPTIGEGCFIGPAVTVSHDTVVGSYCLLSVGSVVGARCDLEDGVLIGSAATLMPPAFGAEARLRIGAGATVGVGSTVIRDVEAGDTVVGTPAKSLKKRND